MLTSIFRDRFSEPTVTIRREHGTEAEARAYAAELTGRRQACDVEICGEYVSARYEDGVELAAASS